MRRDIELSFLELHAVKTAMKASDSKFKKQIIEKLQDEIDYLNDRRTIYYLEAKSKKFGNLENGINFLTKERAEFGLDLWRNSKFFKGKDFEFKMIKKKGFANSNSK